MKIQKAVIFFTFVFLLFIDIACSGNPKIEFSSRSHDFGKVKQNEILKHIFTFKNIGTSTLFIEKIKAG